MSRSDVLKVLKKFKKDNALVYEILDLGIFGSVARGEANSGSDIDIVIKTKTPDPYKIVHIKEDLELQLSCNVDIIRLRDNINPLLYKHIERDAIYV